MRNLPMPRAFQLTWVPPPKAYWRKVYKGAVYTVSCRELGVPKSKEESYRAANDWWQRKKLELDTAARRIPSPEEQLLAGLLGKSPNEPLTPMDRANIAFADARKKLRQRKEEEARRQEMLTNPPAGFIVEDGELVQVYDPDPEELPPVDPAETLKKLLYIKVDQLVDDVLAGKGVPEPLTKHSPALAKPFQDLQALVHKPATPAEKTLGHWRDKFLERKRPGVSKTRFGHYQRQLETFVAHAGGPNADVASLNEQTLESFYVVCSTQAAEKVRKGKYPHWQKNTFSKAKAFLKYLVSLRKIEPLRNLDNAFPIDGVPEEPEPWTLDEIHEAFRLACPRMRLYMLLALNCGMGQGEIAVLQSKEVDYEAGTISRYRFKTRKSKKKWKVTYKLWPITLELLRQFDTGGETVLLSERGNKPLWREGRRDLITQKFNGVREKMRETRPEFDRTFYMLRGTAGSMIQAEYSKDLADMFLAHTPDRDDVTLLNYTGNASQPKLTKAIAWLGEKLGIADPESFPPTPAE
jgi:integrase